MYPNKAKYIFEQTCILFHISYRLTNKAILTKKCVIDFVIIYLFHINKLLIEIEQCFCDMHAVCVGFFFGKEYCVLWIFHASFLFGYTIIYYNFYLLSICMFSYSWIVCQIYSWWHFHFVIWKTSALSRKKETQFLLR